MLGIQAFQSNRLHRLKTSNASRFKSLTTTFGIKKRVDCLFNLSLQADKRDRLRSELFKQPFSESYILHYVLPAKRDDKLTDRLRTKNEYPTACPRTNRYKSSFIRYALSYV